MLQKAKEWAVFLFISRNVDIQWTLALSRSEGYLCPILLPWPSVHTYIQVCEWVGIWDCEKKKKKKTKKKEEEEGEEEEEEEEGKEEEKEKEEEEEEEEEEAEKEEEQDFTVL